MRTLSQTERRRGVWTSNRTEKNGFFSDRREHQRVTSRCTPEQKGGLGVENERAGRRQTESRRERG